MGKGTKNAATLEGNTLETQPNPDKYSTKYLKKINNRIVEASNELTEEKKKRIVALHLWQKIIYCKDADKRISLQNDLAELLDIDIPAEKRTKSFRDYFRFNPSPAETAERDEYLAKEMKRRLFLIPSYNKHMRWMNKKITALLDYYNELTQKIENEKDTAQQTQFKQAQKQTSELLFLLNRDQSFSKLDPNIRITDPGILSIIKNVDKAKQHEFKFYKNELLKTFFSFDAAINKTKLPDHLIDIPTQNLITLMLRRIGGHDYLNELFKKLFPDSNELNEIINNDQDPDGTLTLKIKNHLKRISDQLLEDFDDIQNTNFNDYGFNIDEEKKRKLVLKPFKKVINRWAANKGLGPVLEKIPDVEWERTTCENLIAQLKNMPGNILDLDNNREKLKKYINELEAIKDLELELEKKALTEEELLKERKRRLKFLHTDLIDTLNGTMLEYKEPITLYRKVTQPTHVTHAKVALRERKIKSDNVSKGGTVLLSFGQAAVSAYAFIYLVPVLGWVAIALAPITFVCTLIANTVLFSASTKGTLRQLFVRGDFNKGFDSTGGRRLMKFLWLCAFSLASVMGVLSYLSMIAAIGALGLLFPPIAPILFIAAPILSGIIAATTFIGYTCLMYVSMVTLVEKTYNFLTHYFPAMRDKVGFVEHWKGFKESLAAHLQAHKEKGGFSALIKRTLKRMYDYYWRNPTKNEDDLTNNRELVWRKRIEHILGSLFWAVAVVSGLFLFGISIYATLTVWFKEAVTFFSGTVHLPMLASQIAAAAIIFTFTAVARCVFSLKNYLRSFTATADFATHSVVGNCIKATQLFFNSPKKFFEEAGNKISSIKNSVVKFWNDRHVNKDQTWGWFADKVWNCVVLPGTILFNTVANFALVIKNAIIPAGLGVDEVFDPALAEEVSLSDSKTFDYFKATSYAAASATVNGNSAWDLVHSEPMSYIPLQEMRDKRMGQEYLGQTLHKGLFNDSYNRSSSPPILIQDPSNPNLVHTDATHHPNVFAC